MELEVSKLQAHPKPYEISRLDSSLEIKFEHYDVLPINCMINHIFIFNSRKILLLYP